jgi:hypothetical protein
MEIETSAASLRELAEKTRPIVQFDDEPGPLFLWTGVEKKTRYFEIASAGEFQAASGSPAWIIARFGAEGDFLGRVRIDPGAPLRPDEPRAGSRFYWRPVLSDPARGTVYEIEYYLQFAGEAAMGRRLVVLQTPAGAWRFVARLDGNYWDDTGQVLYTTVRAAWTDDPKAPLSLREYWTVQGHDPRRESIPEDLTLGGESTYSGTLPLKKPVSTRYFIKVTRGQTFTLLLRQLARNDTEDATLSAGAMRQLRAAIVALNPRLEPDRLAIGQEITIPAFKERRRLEAPAAR